MSKLEPLLLPCDDLRLAYNVAGEGPLVVAMPGMGDVRNVYRHLTPLLTAAGLRVATLDLPGHGESDVPQRRIGQRDIAAAAAALTRQLGGPAIVIGHSFTPDSALAASQLIPDQVLGAVAIAPFATTPPMSLPKRAAASLVTRIPAAWSRFYASLHVTLPADFAEHRRLITNSLRRPGGKRVLATMARGETKDAVDARATQRAPVAVIMGSGDPDFPDPEAEARAYSSDIAALTTVTMIDSAGHYPHSEQPDATARAILDFARSVGLTTTKAHNA